MRRIDRRPIGPAAHRCEPGDPSAATASFLAMGLIVASGAEGSDIAERKRQLRPHGTRHDMIGPSGARP